MDVTFQFNTNMRNIFIFLIVFLISFAAKSQVYQSMPQYGYGPVQRMAFDSALTLPKGLGTVRTNNAKYDTAQIRYYKNDSSVYVYTGFQWRKISSNGSTDSSIFATMFRLDSVKENRVVIGSDASLRSLTITGTNGSGDIHLRHQASLPTATGQSTSLYANSDGNLAWKNDGNYHTTLASNANTADRVYTFQNKSYTIADNADVALKLAITDTANMRVRLVAGTNITSISGTYPNLTINAASQTTDTSSLSNRINSKLNISDTVNMRVRLVAGTNITSISGTYPNLTINAASQSTDTTSLSNRINSKLNISDTANMRSRLIAGTGISITGTYPNQTIAKASSATDSSFFWQQGGNAITSSGNKWIGTTNNTSLRLFTNNTDRMYVDSAGLGLFIGGSSQKYLQLNGNGNEKIINNTQGGGYAITFQDNSTSSMSVTTSNMAIRGGLTVGVAGATSSGGGAVAPNASSILDVRSTTKGFLPPRMTTTQRDAISSPAAGLMIYNTTTNKLNFYNGTAWEAVTSS